MGKSPILVDEELARRYKGRYYGKYRARVVDNQDPKKLNRVRTEMPQLFGKGVILGWALPALPPHLSDVPEIGKLTWIEFEAGDTDFPIWSGCWWAVRSGVSELPENAQDKDDSVMYNVLGGSSIILKKDGSVEVISRTGSSVFIDSSGEVVIHSIGKVRIDSGSEVVLGNQSGYVVTSAVPGPVVDISTLTAQIKTRA